MSNLPASGVVTRLAILGTLSYAPMHGYEIRRELEARRVERWADVSYGSIYGRLRRLVEAGMVEVVGTEREANRPSRTVYRITDAGNDELGRTMREALSQPEFGAQTVDLALSYCVTPAARFGEEPLRHLLEQRLAHLEQLAEEFRQALFQPVSDQPGVRALVEDLIGHSQRRVEVERQWTEHVLGRLSAGDYHTPAAGPVDPADLTSPAAQEPKP